MGLLRGGSWLGNVWSPNCDVQVSQARQRSGAPGGSEVTEVPSFTGDRDLHNSHVHLHEEGDFAEFPDCASISAIAVSVYAGSVTLGTFACLFGLISELARQFRN